MTEDRDPIEQWLDVAFYAPLGLALSARDRLPEWAQKGRQELTARVPLARLVGQVVIDKGATEAKRRVDALPARVREVLSDLGLLATVSLVEEEGEGVPSQSPDGDNGGGGSPGGAAAPQPGVADVADAAVPAVSTPVEPAGDSADLPIPGYDTLSASQVVQRLTGLSPEELDAVRSYETSRRRRKIVLLKLDQLRAAS